jgi:hypothetical protein
MFELFPVHSSPLYILYIAIANYQVKMDERLKDFQVSAHRCLLRKSCSMANCCILLDAIQNLLKIWFSEFNFDNRLIYELSRIVNWHFIWLSPCWSVLDQVRRTGFLVYIKLDFYCLCSLQKSISKLIFAG